MYGLYSHRFIRSSYRYDGYAGISLTAHIRAKENCVSHV